MAGQRKADLAQFLTEFQQKYKKHTRNYLDNTDEQMTEEKKIASLHDPQI